MSPTNCAGRRSKGVAAPSPAMTAAAPNTGSNAGHPGKAVASSNSKAEATIATNPTQHSGARTHRGIRTCAGIRASRPPTANSQARVVGKK